MFSLCGAGRSFWTQSCYYVLISSPKRGALWERLGEGGAEVRLPGVEPRASMGKVVSVASKLRRDAYLKRQGPLARRLAAWERGGASIEGVRTFACVLAVCIEVL